MNILTDDRGAITSLIVDSDALSIGEITDRLGQPTPDQGTKPSSHWHVDFESPDYDPDDHNYSPLTDELASVERFLAERIDALEDLAAACDIWLFATWSPKPNQDHAQLSAELVRLLGRIGATVTIDTWTEGNDDPPAEAS